MKSTPTDSPTMAAPTANMRNSPNSNVYSLPSVNNAIWATSTSQPRSRSLQNELNQNGSPPTSGVNGLNTGNNPFSGSNSSNRFNKVIGHNPPSNSNPISHPSPPSYPNMVQSPLHMGLAQTPVQQITNPQMTNVQNPNNVIIHNTLTNNHYHTTENTNIYTHHQAAMGPPMLINLNALSQHPQGTRQR